MSGLDGNIVISSNEYRPCIINGEKGLFHKWVDKEELFIKLDSIVSKLQLDAAIDHFENCKKRNTIPNGVTTDKIRTTLGIVEFEDGTIEEVMPTAIQFLDSEERFKNICCDAAWIRANPNLDINKSYPEFMSKCFNVPESDMKKVLESDWSRVNAFSKDDINTMLKTKNKLENPASDYIIINDKDIEKILERADVVWQDDKTLMKRTVVSRNVKYPLTEEEQKILERMWHSYGLWYEFEFKVGGEF